MTGVRIHQGPRINIAGSMNRDEIVRQVVNVFLDVESKTRGKGIRFRYPVDDISIGGQLYILRPAGLGKWNFDFKVEVPPEFGLKKGTHDNVINDLMEKKKENSAAFPILKDVLAALYNCVENDVDHLLQGQPGLQSSFSNGAKVDVLLKVIKWMFIMEDIVYWNYLGRAKLYEEALRDL